MALPSSSGVCRGAWLRYDRDRRLLFKASVGSIAGENEVGVKLKSSQPPIRPHSAAAGI